MLEQLLKKWNIKYFSVDEITLHRRWDKNILPPKRKLSNIKHTIILADAIRKVWGKPVRVNSGYRNSEYNKLVGGAPTSEHEQFKALDLSPIDGNIEEFRKVLVAVVTGARAAGFNVGLGLYDTFCHIDTNASNKNTNRNWDLRSK
jgi:uncharacterized protein YcbK (DUF882 family)